MARWESMTDAELVAVRAALPQYRNNMTPEDLAEADACYGEQMRRYRAAAEDYNRRAAEATGLRHGDMVEYAGSGIFGLGAEVYRGRVVKNNRGRLAVRTETRDGTGRKTFKIHSGWTLIKGV